MRFWRRAPRVVWENDPIKMSADQALAVANSRVSDPSAIDEALEFVRKAIDGKPWIPSNELFELGQAHGFQPKAIRRAAARLGYRPKKTGWGHGGSWIFKTTDPDFKERLHMSETEPDDKDDYYESD
jgi:hypothetical protein